MVLVFRCSDILVPVLILSPRRSCKTSLCRYGGIGIARDQCEQDSRYKVSLNLSLWNLFDSHSARAPLSMSLIEIAAQP